MSSDEKKDVVLLHGLAGTPTVWSRDFCRRLVKDGWSPWAFGYASMRGSVDDHARHVLLQLQRHRLLNRPVSFVCHSLGGLVLLHCLALSSEVQAEQIVFIACPLRGSRLAYQMSNTWLRPLASRVLGPVFQELVALWGGEPSLSFAKPTCPVHMIYGTRSWGIWELGSWFGRWALPGFVEHDGLVCKDEQEFAWVNSSQSFPLTHNALLWHEEPQRAIVSMLRGEGKKSSSSSDST